MESKRLGLVQKSLFVVPNHLTEQWASEFLQLYPSANILVATKKDFETRNRKKFCGRIATGDYDAVIIGHSQLEKIPVSIERQQRTLEEEINDITCGIQDLKSSHGERFTVKQMEKTKKSLEAKLAKLNDDSRKDDVVTFEELGVDRLFVDEAHSYKNLFLYTKMRNVAGISQTEAQKSSDLFMKCRYLDEITDGRGIVFATGTPISNSMTELYTMQRYLQYADLNVKNLHHFDCWASTFGETVTAIELAPEGTGYRAKTRFSRFYNLPELMAMFREVADIQTADMLNLPIPALKGNTITNVVIKPSEMQKDLVLGLAERAEKVRNGTVSSQIDNMLTITNDGRKLALDQRLLNAMLPDESQSKVNSCVENIYRTWDETKEQQLTQLVFCDLSTPRIDDSFTVYNDVKNKLISKGVLPEQIAFIHDANNESQKAELFTKMRKGQVRVLIGSTFKCGAGTNIQDRLVALHHLDVPWRPSDIEQRAGRILRQGNQNKEVEIFRYVTEGTFDAYSWQLIENKQKFIAQIMTSKSPVRSAEDIDETALSYAEVKALATGNPYIREKMDLDVAVARLKLLKADFNNQHYLLEDSLIKHFPMQIQQEQERIAGYEADIAQRDIHTHAKEGTFAGMDVNGIQFAEKADAGKAILSACQKLKGVEPVKIGHYRGFELFLSFDSFNKQFKIELHNTLRHGIVLGNDVFGNITRLEHALNGLDDRLSFSRDKLEGLYQQIENAKAQLEKPFQFESELAEKVARITEINILLDLDEGQQEILGEIEPEQIREGSIRTYKDECKYHCI